jgi:hypothetical protein
LFVGGKTITGVYPIDWVASKGIPGIGASLLRQIGTLADVCCCIGGTESAQTVIAHTGFVPSGKMKYYSRPLRPWKQLCTHQEKNWKLPVRFARNLVWAARSGSQSPARWTAECIQPQDVPSCLFPFSNADFIACRRTPELFQYLFSCPVARYELHIARKDGAPRGYFLLSYTPGQARVADSFVLTNEEEDWKALYKLAASVAHANGSAAEIKAASALEPGQRGLEAAGFRVHEALPIMLFDPKNLLSDVPPIHLQMIDNDFSFLHQGRPEYWT